MNGIIFELEEKLKYDFKPFDKVLVRKEGNKKMEYQFVCKGNCGRL